MEHGVLSSQMGKLGQVPCFPAAPADQTVLEFVLGIYGALSFLNLGSSIFILHQIPQIRYLKSPGSGVGIGKANLMERGGVLSPHLCQSQEQMYSSSSGTMA